MSNVSGVYILKTGSYYPNENEYRVAAHRFVEDFYKGFDDERKFWKPDWDKIHSVFDSSKVFYREEDARQEAEKVASHYEYLDDGIYLIKFWDDAIYSKSGFE
jgi:hypothetical protein